MFHHETPDTLDISGIEWLHNIDSKVNSNLTVDLPKNMQSKIKIGLREVSKIHYFLLTLSTILGGTILISINTVMKWVKNVFMVK